MSANIFILKDKDFFKYNEEFLEICYFLLKFLCQKKMDLYVKVSICKNFCVEAFVCKKIFEV